MKKRKSLLALVGSLFFAVGIMAGMGLCAWYSWGEAEAVFFISRTGDVTLKVYCPLMIGANETGEVTAYFDNPTNEEINPTVWTEIRQQKAPREETTVLTLRPGEVKKMQWKVSREDVDFGALIMVNILESSQNEYPSHQGSCGIMVLPFAVLNGRDALIGIYLFSILMMFAGGGLWVKGCVRLKGQRLSIKNAGSTLMGAVVIGLAAILLHWWVLSGLLFLGSIMMIVVMATEFWLYPEGWKSLIVD